MKMKTAAATLVLLVLIVVAGGYLWYAMGKPLYEPGMVRAGKNLRASLTPPKQPDDEHFWNGEQAHAKEWMAFLLMLAENMAFEDALENEKPFLVRALLGEMKALAEARGEAND